MRADFLRRCQNSLRQTSPEMMHFQAWKKNILTDIMSLLLIQSGFRHTKHLKMTVWISVLWKILCSWQKNGQKWSFKGHLWVINFLSFFLQNCKKLEAKKKVFYVIAFDLIQILKSWASQNDLSFVKAINLVGKKWPETVSKCPTPRVVRFISDQSLHTVNLQNNSIAIHRPQVFDRLHM